MIVHRESKSLLLKLRPEPFATLKSILPNHTREIDYDGHNMAVPHNLKLTKILRNMGIKAPHPMRYYYDWPRPARFDKVMEHQYITADFATMYPKLFVLNEMGTSKTASVIWSADYLMLAGEIKRVLIVAPLSVLDVWSTELFDVTMHRKALVVYGDAEKRRALFDTDADFYIINPEGLEIIAGQLAKRKDIDLVIVDEAADYRNATTNKYEMLRKVTKERKLWMLTGAPCPQAPTDAWALARLVDPGRVPEYFSQFRSRTMQKLTQYKWIPQPGGYEMAYQALQPAIRFRKKDCIDLPPVTITDRKVELTDEQKKAYEAMKTHLVAEAAAGHVVTAVNAADKIAKLRQILLGAVKDGDDYVTINHSKRLDELCNCIDQAKAKTLVIVPYKGIARCLTDEVNAWHDKRGDGKRCMLVNGDVTVNERNRIFQDFRDDPDLNELICHPMVMSHGLTLVQADMMVFYGPINSNDRAAQVEARINRPGQVNSMTIVRLVANQLEKNIYLINEGRAIGQASMLDLYNAEMNGA
jgi:SNF2 family DNA or RNA helicase